MCISDLEYIILDFRFKNENIELNTLIAKLRKSGCAVVGKQDMLVCYKSKHWQHSIENINYAGANPVRVPYLECGAISDSGADDELYFEAGYLCEEDEQ